MIDHIIPQPTKESIDLRAYQDRGAYMQGQEDFLMELPRQGGVHYNDNRSIDCYNMGYSSGDR